MEHKIKYFLIYSNSIDNPVDGEGILTDEQIELLKKANDCMYSSPVHYVISLEDGSSFDTVYTYKDFLDIDEEKFNKWKKENHHCKRYD